MIPPAAIKIGKDVLNKVGIVLKSKAAKDFLKDVVIQGGTQIFVGGVEKLLSDNDMSFKQKLKQLKKLKKRGEITEEQYIKYHEQLMNKQFSSV